MLPDKSPTGQWRGMPWWEAKPAKLASEPCPHCARPLARYERPLTNTMALKLIHVYQLHLRHPERKHFHVKEFDGLGGRGEFGTLSNWALVQEAEKTQNTGARTSGFWSLTEFGRAFVRGDVEVPQYVMLKAGSQLLGFAGPMRRIRESLHRENRFSYEELVSATIEKYQQMTLDRMFMPKAM